MMVIIFIFFWIITNLIVVGMACHLKNKIFSLLEFDFPKWAI